MANGTVIHAMLEGYYAGKSMGASEAACREAALEALVDAASAGGNISELGEIRSLVTGYFDHYVEQDDERYEVVAVETKMKADLSDDYAMVGTIDLVWKDLTDGMYVVVDHKSSYNFWTQDQADISSQFPKYAYILNRADMPVKQVIVNQLRTRKLKEGNEIYRRTFVDINPHVVEAAVDQHVRASEEIVKWREEPRKERLVPVFDKHTCKGCNFLTLCTTDLNSSANIKYAVQGDYKKRTGYGYNPTETP